MRNEGYWRYQVYRDRVERALADRYPLRMHMSIIVAIAVAAGLAFDALLVAAGSRSMTARYLFAVLVGHATFLAGVRLWLAYSGVAGLINRKKAHLLVGDDVWPPEPWKPSEAGEAEVGIAAGADPQILFYFLGGLMALTVVFTVFGGWALLVAPAIFGDAVLAKLHAARLLERVDSVEASGWITAVMRHTGFTLLFSLAVAAGVGVYARFTAPGANSVLDLL